MVALGGMHGCSWGACMVAPGGGHVWLLLGGMHGCSWGACVVALGGCAWLLQGGHAWLLRGCAWLLRGGVHGCSREGRAWLLLGGMRGWSGGSVCGFFNEIRSMSGRYTSYWNAFLLQMPSLAEFFAVNTKLPINSNIGIKGFYRSKKKLSPVGLDLMITGSRDYYWFDCLMFNQLR